MANVLTDLAADLYVAADEVGRELTGAVSSVLINANGSERAAKGDTVRSHFTRASGASSAISESMTIPQGTDQTVDNKTLTISKAQSIQIPWTGEDIKHVNNGSGFSTIYGDQIKQAMRTLANEMESDLLAEIYKNASRAYGTAGTTPFASNFKDVAELRQILVDNGCPTDDLFIIMDTLAGTKLRNLAQLQKANESGSDSMLRQGVLLDLQGIAFKESAQVAAHTKGTGSGFLLNDASSAVGDTTITVDTGTGTIVAGDIITFAADTVNKYVVVTALSGNDVIIAEPGLRESIADSNAITVGNNYTANVAFRRNAVELVMRAPALPEGGDAADDGMVIQDPHSGLVFEVRSYKGYRKSMFEVAVAYGQKAWKTNHIAGFLG